MDDKSMQTEILPLMQLPDVVIVNLISFLPPETCLALRRVCKTTLYWITTFACSSTGEFEKWKKYRFRITGKAPYTFTTAVKMNLPITWFYLQNYLNKQKIYESEGVYEFIELFKSRKVRLHFDIDLLLMLQSANERAFYSSFENIRELRINRLQTFISALVSSKDGPNYDDEFFRNQFLNAPPNIMSSLKRLIIYNYDEHSALLPAGAEHLSDELLLCFITSFKNLTWVTPPSKLKKLSRGNGLVEFFMPRKRTYCPTWMQILGTAIIENDWRSTQEETSQEDDNEQLSVDLRGFMKLRYIVKTYRSYLQSYLLLLQESHRRGILLRNVSSTVLDSMYSYLWELGWSEEELRDSFTFLNSIVSLYNVHNVLRFGFCEMRKLEEITIYHNFAIRQWLYYDPPELSWDSLKTLKVSVYITEETFTSMSRNIWDLTFRRVFDNAKRSSVTTLTLRENSNKDSILKENNQFFNQKTFFDASVICNNFTCLKSLTIHGCTASVEYFDTLFSGLPHLTFVNVAACTQFDGYPVRFLSVVTTFVLALDNMPNITESFFTDILCHIPLKQFRMIAKKSTPIFTTRAMLALQEGTFGKTIEKFPFDTWKSKYIKGKKKSLLQKEFRFMK